VLAALLTSTSDHPLARGAAQVFSDWQSAIAVAVCERGVSPEEALRRARAALSLLQGGLVMTRALGDPAALREALALARDTLLPREEKP
jgi:hypothetical protein